MSFTVARDLYDTRLDGKWKTTQPSAVPTDDKYRDNGNQGAAWNQQGSAQDPRTLASQQLPSDKQAPTHAQDDGQYHPNAPSSPNKQINPDTVSSTGVKGLTLDNQGISSVQQASPQKPQGGQTSPIQQTSSDKQAATHTQDDGQYHPEMASGDKGSSSSSSSANDGQYHPAQQQTDGQPQLDQQLASTQHGSIISTDDGQYHPSQPSSWDQYTQSGQNVGAAVDATQPQSSTQLQPLASASQTTTTSAPPVATSSIPASSASSAPKYAAIALSVTGAVAFIAILILLPLFKRRKRLQKAYCSEKTESVQRDPPKSIVQSFNNFLSSVHAQSARALGSAPGFFRPQRQAPGNVTILVGTQPSNETNHAIIDPSKSPNIETIPALRISPSTSVASWETERSLASSRSHYSSHSSMAPSMAPSEDQQREPTKTTDLGTMYGLESLENVSMGNLLAINPLMNNIHTVEMDYSPSRSGQLELRVGQRLGILQVFDNGWALGMRLDCPEAGLLPRSHVSAVPHSQPLQCTDEKRKSNRFSFPRKPSSKALSSRFYSLFSNSAQPSGHPSPV